MKYATDLKSRSFVFAVEVFRLLDTLPSKRSFWIVSDQLGRCASSIGANVHEAHGSRTRIEYRRFHEIAFKSANETCYWLKVLDSIQKNSRNEILLKEGEELAKMLGATIKSLSK